MKWLADGFLTAFGFSSLWLPPVTVISPAVWPDQFGLFIANYVCKIQMLD